MSGWHAFPVRTTLEQHFGVPVFVDNDVNLMTLGAWTAEGGNEDDLVLVKAGTGIGAGLIVNGRIARGALGAAGDFGHTTIAEASRVQCRCGNFGCLEALAGGWALARDAYTAAFTRDSTYLQDLIARTGTVEPLEIARGARDGDEVCQALIERSGELLGASIATMTSILNPSTVFIAGALSEAGPIYLDAIAAQVKRRVLPLATENLRLEIVPLQHREGGIGASAFAIDSLLAPPLLAKWFGLDPHGVSARPAAMTSDRA
jgi:predicted NBD/HSP70 family sugar kinase